MGSRIRGFLVCWPICFLMAAFAAASDETRLDCWIFAAGAGAIDRVWRGGVRCVEGGHHHHAPEIAERYRRCIARITA